MGINEKDAGHGKLQWHPGFLQAIKLELSNYKESLEFKYEYQLTSEPLRIDLLIIKKPKSMVVDKNIARIFKADNLLEYKSPSVLSFTDTKMQSCVNRYYITIYTKIDYIK
jgi:hypothetical protein